MILTNFSSILFKKRPLFRIMKSVPPVIAKIILISFFYVLFGTSRVSAEGVLNVVTTLGQIRDVVEHVGGTHVHVTGLMGPGVDPHLYKATASDVSKLAEADIIFYNGLNLEAKMGDIFKKMGSSKVTVSLGDFLPKEDLLESLNYKGHYDPHIWFDVTLWIQIVEKVRDVLSEHDPSHKEQYHTNASIYLQALEQLHAYVQKRGQELPDDQRVLVTAHDAFRYFGRRYGFEVYGLQGISTESQAGTRDVMELADLIARRKVRAIFVESSVPERNIKAVQEAVRARGWDVKIGGELFSDAMGSHGTLEGSYVGMVTHNIDTLVDALKP